MIIGLTVGETNAVEAFVDVEDNGMSVAVGDGISVGFATYVWAIAIWIVLSDIDKEQAVKMRIIMGNTKTFLIIHTFPYSKPWKDM